MEIRIIAYFEHWEKSTMPIRSHPKLMDRLSIYLLTLCSQALSSFQEWSLMAAGGEETHFSPFDWGRDFCASQGHTHQCSRDWSWVFQVLWLPCGAQIPPHLLHRIPAAWSSPKAPPASPSPHSALQHSGVGYELPCLGKGILHSTLGCGGLGCDEDPSALG